MVTGTDEAHTPGVCTCQQPEVAHVLGEGSTAELRICTCQGVIEPDEWEYTDPVPDTDTVEYHTAPNRRPTLDDYPTTTVGETVRFIARSVRHGPDPDDWALERLGAWVLWYRTWLAVGALIASEYAARRLHPAAPVEAIDMAHALGVAAAVVALLLWGWSE